MYMLGAASPENDKPRQSMALPLRGNQQWNSKFLHFNPLHLSLITSKNADLPILVIKY